MLQGFQRRAPAPGAAFSFLTLPGSDINVFAPALCCGAATVLIARTPILDKTSTLYKPCTPAARKKAAYIGNVFWRGTDP